MDEIMDLYDRNRQITKNTYIRGSAQPKGFFRLVVHVCIFNSKGELLIQQRTLNKKMPGLWDVTCGGAVSTKELSSQGAQRELSEELGINIDFTNIRPSLTANFAQGFDDFYILHRDIDLDDLVLQKEEVADARWENLDGVLALRRANKFVGYKESFIRFLFDLSRDNRYVEI
ncbi:NUDIX domain-containing protein [Anaerococcus sp.]|uniref:NUDIX hydrolase n=1 Tax=Anaerococcus sp. TaxID=1872515 RepID=UPI00257BB44B|nr:NUDIX domain-containing protein [Anaerococcus sp.]MBS6106311.1 NUDIX domain-containing protein [Anaerococcus sp.]